MALLILSLAGCANHPRPKAPHIDAKLSPRDVLAHPRATRGARVRWGGMVIGDNVGPVRSTLTILAYPLDEDGRPFLGRTDWGRFQAVAPGYLDPVLFAQGRLITVVGTVVGTRTGLVGQAHYLYPRVRILATHLWQFYRRRPRSHWRFGFGFGIGL
ncbi:MAG: Slp family lipoprotein [Acidiferrobacter sp.]